MNDKKKKKKWCFGLLQSTVEFFFFYFIQNTPNCLHPHTYVHKASKSPTEGQACRKVLGIKWCVGSAAQLQGSCRGPGWFSVCQTDESESEPVIGRGHSGQVCERLQPLAGNSTFAQWDVWQMSDWPHVLLPEKIYEAISHSNKFWKEKCVFPSEYSETITFFTITEMVFRSYDSKTANTVQLIKSPVSHFGL